MLKRDDAVGMRGELTHLEKRVTTDDTDAADRLGSLPFRIRVIRGIRGSFPGDVAAILLRILVWSFGVWTAGLIGHGADTWSDAQRLFAGGKYREAATLLDGQARATPRSAEVWFNLGQACFQAGDPGRALAAWEHAVELSPRDREYRAALALVRGRVQAPPEPVWVDALGWLATEEWAIAWLVSAAILGATFATCRNVAGGVVLLRVAAALGNAGTGALWLAALIAAHHRSDVVVIAREVQLLQSPVPQARVVRGLSEGTTFRVSRTFNDWCEVTQNGRTAGWVRRDALLRFRD